MKRMITWVLGAAALVSVAATPAKAADDAFDAFLGIEPIDYIRTGVPMLDQFLLVGPGEYGDFLTFLLSPNLLHDGQLPLLVLLTDPKAVGAPMLLFHTMESPPNLFHVRYLPTLPSLAGASLPQLFALPRVPK